LTAPSLRRLWKEVREMSKGTKSWLKIALIAGLILLLAAPTFTRPITMKEVAAAIWIFMVIGALIVSLQLVPAAILFFVFVGIASVMIFKKLRQSFQVSSDKRGTG
jgi:hypothetical protein